MPSKRNNLNEYNWDVFFDEFQKETPRAAVILSGAFLDLLLKDLLASFMIEDGAVDELLGTEKYSETPLGSFGARIKAAYCLGLIGKVEYNDLKQVKNIRNIFAHKLHGYSFDDKEIVKLCDKLQTPLSFKETSLSFIDSHRGKYVFTVSILCNQIGLKILDVQKEKRVIREDMKLGPVIRVDGTKTNSKAAG